MTSRLRLLAFSILCVIAFAQKPSGFQHLADYVAVGGNFGELVGPAAEPGKERVYAVYSYLDDTFDLVAVDPEKGSYTTYPNPVHGESGSRCQVFGPDKNLYLGTLPGAHLLKFEVKTSNLLDLGCPAKGEQYIWCLTVGPDAKIYGGTYPDAKLITYDPGSGKMADLGRVDPTEQYLHYVAAGTDGFIYGGVGSSHMGIIAYNLATGARTELLPDQFRINGFCQVFSVKDGSVYATAGSLRFKLLEGKAFPVDPKACPSPEAVNRLQDGRLTAVSGGALTIMDPKQPSMAPAVKEFHYRGRPMKLFRMGVGPDQTVYLNSMLPSRLVRFKPSSSSFQDIGEIGDGEVYSFLAHGRDLLMGGYGTMAPLMAYDLSLPYAPGANNPRKIRPTGVEETWRPLAAVTGPQGDDKVYFGGRPGYGKLGANLVEWNPLTGEVATYPSPIQEQSIASLAIYQGMILGGTNIDGGMGSVATQKIADLFLWDPKGHSRVWGGAPLPDATVYDNLVVGPNGLIYGLAGNTFFVFDFPSKSLKYRHSLPFNGGTIYNSLAMGPDGRLWGLSSVAGVFAINPSTYVVSVMQAPAAITGGSAFLGRDLYMICGASLYRYTLP
jgi:hypothetical protein